MSLSRIFMLICCTVVMTACGANLAEKHAAFDALSQVRIDTENTRPGQVFRLEMQRLLSRGKASEKRYRLNTKITTTFLTDAVDMTVVITLYDEATGVDVLQKSFLSSASVGGVASLYGAEAAKNNALERLAIASAQKTYRYLLLHFTQTAEQPLS